MFLRAIDQYLKWTVIFKIAQLQVTPNGNAELVQYTYTKKMETAGSSNGEK